jgi:hypothetical protein
VTRPTFLTLFGSREGERLARIAIESLRAFGGPLRDCPVWAFVPATAGAAQRLPGVQNGQRIPLTVPEATQGYPFAEKVRACAVAEAMAGPDVRSLVWLSPTTLIINPPSLFDLGAATGIAAAGVAVRPVHHRNIGSPVHEPLDPYWRAIYTSLGVGRMAHAVTSFADGVTIRPYFNTHCFAFDPATGLAHRWWSQFEAMVRDENFQNGPCQDMRHKVFLHQAILSTLIATTLPWERVRHLPPTYNYPLDLLSEIALAQRAETINRVVTAVYENTFPWHAITVEEPLRSWLHARQPGRRKPAA